MGEFFDTMTDSSAVKATIVEKYFDAWSKIVVPRTKTKAAYIDLFSGPGRYANGSPSTPLKVLDLCIKSNVLRSKVQTIFNDANSEYAEKLQSEIDSLGGIETLTHKPIIYNSAVGNDLAKIFADMQMVPTLSFVDPWGYKGLTRDLIQALIKDWGSDIIFFFNYNRINAAITNYKVEDHINAIFGEERANELRNIIGYYGPEDREAIIINELGEALSLGKKRFVLPFRFVDSKKDKTSHYLIFVSKHPLGYHIMKDIMWKCSSEKTDGVACFSYLPVTDPQLSLLFALSQPIEDLGETLLNFYQSSKLTVREVYERHNIGTPYVLSNYKEALKRLESASKIRVIPPVEKRRKNTMGDDVTIVFPARSK